MQTPDPAANSPLGTYYDYLNQGQLAYQVAADSGAAVFFPRVAAPVTGAALEWRTSKGLGTVYSTTVVSHKGEAPLNVALIDLDEGFRMLSRVEDIDPMRVKIGMRVRVRIKPGADGKPPLPVFVPESLQS
jgi:uncharacterized OB-fold protein